MRNQKGLTLVTLIALIVVIPILLLGLIHFTYTQSIEGVKLRDFLTAQHLAKQKMAEMNNTAYASLPVGTAALPGEASFPAFQFQRVISNVATSGAVSVRQVEIMVDTTTGSFSPPLVQLITYRQSDTTFGNGT